ALDADLPLRGGHPAAGLDLAVLLVAPHLFVDDRGVLVVVRDEPFRGLAVGADDAAPGRVRRLVTLEPHVLPDTVGAAPLRADLAAVQAGLFGQPAEPANARVVHVVATQEQQVRLFRPRVEVAGAGLHQEHGDLRGVPTGLDAQWRQQVHLFLVEHALTAGERQVVPGNAGRDRDRASVGVVVRNVP